MKRLTATGLTLMYLLTVALGIYEVTAKSPSLLGTRLPGWWATNRAEHRTRWNPPTGIQPLDKLLHEAEESVRFYGFIAHKRP